jgi:hypothetical protein
MDSAADTLQMPRAEATRNRCYGRLAGDGDASAGRQRPDFRAEEIRVRPHLAADAAGDSDARRRGQGRVDVKCAALSLRIPNQLHTDCNRLGE